MASPAPRSLFSDVPIDITMYEHHIIASALSSSHDCPDLNPDNYTAAELRIYKSKSSPFHECLVADITSPNSSRTTLLRLERTRPRPTDRDIEVQQESSPENRAVASALRDACQESIDDRVTPQNAPPDLDDDERELNRPSQIFPTNIEPLSIWNSSTSIFQQASATASSSSESISESVKLITGTESRDIITMISRYPDARHHDLIEIFRPKSFSLVSLAILAKIVHEKHPLYSLFHRQCFWYANLIMRVVAKNFGGEDGPQPRERHPEEPSAWVRYQQSTYLFIKVGRVRESMVHAISEKLDIVMADVQAQISRHHDSEQNIQQAKQRAEAAEKSERKAAEEFERKIQQVEESTREAVEESERKVRQAEEFKREAVEESERKVRQAEESKREAAEEFERKILEAEQRAERSERAYALLSNRQTGGGIP